METSISKLRRTLSTRRRSSYSTLPTHSSVGKPRGEKITTIHEDEENQSTKRSNRKSNTDVKEKENCKVDSNSSKSNDGNTKSQPKEGPLPGLNTMKSAILNIGRKLRKKQYKKIALRESPHMVNGAYTTPRRSERIKALSTPSPLALRMYSPFCIETPGLDDSFTRISKRKAPVDINESPLTKTPRRMVSAAVTAHKKLGNSISSTKLAVPTLSGY